MKFSDQVAIITGCGGTIGQTIALELAKKGAHLAVVTMQSLQEGLVQEIKAHGGKAIALHCDLTSKDAVDLLVKQVVETFGKVDLLVNNAGRSARAPLLELAEEDWERVIAVNLKGVYLCSVAAAKEMLKTGKGNIINIAGASAHNCLAGGGAFGPSKAGVVNLTRQMAVEWARYNIRVNGISPGPVSGPETEKRMKEGNIKEKIAKIPLARIAEPEEIADVALFLAAEESSYITGQTIIVDGGSTFTWYLNQ